MSEDKVRTKDSCWSVGTIYDPRELPGVSTTGLGIGRGVTKDLKGVQRVMGCLAALSRFISCLGERGLPLYRLLRKTERFTWTPEAEEAIGNLKALLSSAPILVPLAAGEALLIYVAATTQVVSAAIVVERQEERHALLVQRPVYFISEVLFETKIRYPQI
jgi:hypothetical protein